MVSKVIHAYFQSLQDFFNPLQIYFDTIYTADIEDYRKAMSSYNLRQQYDFDRLKSAHITEDLLKSLRANRPGGGSYNVIQYKFSPLTRTELHPNNEPYYIVYSNNGNIQKVDMRRNFRELPRDEELYLQAEYQEFLKTQPNSPLQRELHDTISGNIDPKIELDNKSFQLYQRLAVYGDITLECRFLTTNTSLFEDFMILYNARLCDVNPPAYLTLKHAPDVKYPITTRYQEIDTAERLDGEKYGNLTMVGFTVTLTSMFLSSYVKKSAPVNKVSVFTEVQSKST